MPPQVVSAGNLLLVEGNDDEHVIRRLCERCQAVQNFRIDRKDNVERLWPRAERYIDGIPQEHRRFRTPKTTRAKVHAWLAAQERPRPMGLAIRAGDLDVTRPAAQTFLTWLGRCFSNGDGGRLPA